MIEILPVNTTYEPFSHEPEYVAANQGFATRVPLGHVKRILDLACGTGTISEILISLAPGAHLNGVDYDPVQIELSSDRFRKLGFDVRTGFALTDDVVDGKPALVFGCGSATDLPFPDETFDCITIANAIHVIDDKEKLLKTISRLLKPGGLFGFNSTFYSGSVPEGTDRMYMDWLILAAKYIEEKNKKLAAAGAPTIKRVRGTTRKAFTNRWYSPSEWSDMLDNVGLKTVDTNERLVELSERSFTYVGAYGGLAEVLMSGFPVEEAAEALQNAAGPAMRGCGATVAPRNYLEMWAVKS
ncbi:class I SAM-dependent methyltransferase [Schlesneria paludicola]|uniref:class I SAM-dependent methyltransferase n=1 Tax=Schlesneria paludicola TaxID=360056 RepID=UPI00029AA051|nr:class I SAM-dependent methyltransferase [Schlesneria paludicola]